MRTHHRLGSFTAVLAVLAGTTACTGDAADPGRSAPTSTSAPSAARSGQVIPSESLRGSTPAQRGNSAGRSPSNQPLPGLTPAQIPEAAAATRDPITAARAWAVAGNSSSYLDPEPGSWTLRSAPFVTGPEQTAEQAQRRGGGGATWAQIQSARCVTGLRQLTASAPSTLPSGPARRIVYVAGLTALTCATGQVQLSQFAAQLTLTRVRGRWLVAAVEH